MRIMEQQANSASESFKLLRTQWFEERRRELLRAISILDDIRYESTQWKDISDNKWGTVSSASSILPPDSNVVQFRPHGIPTNYETRFAKHFDYLRLLITK